MAMNQGGTNPGDAGMTAKRSRLKRGELRELLLETGRAILRDEGLGSGAESLTFKKVFDRVEAETGIRLTNASVIRRVWENQAQFQLDVLVTVAFGQNKEEIDLAMGSVGPTLSRLDLTTPESRDEALRELCRVGGALNAESVRRSSNWPLLIGVWSLAAAGGPLDQRKKIEAALLSGYGAFIDRIETIYSSMAAFLGLRLREEFTLRQFAVAVDSLGQGYGLHDRLDGFAVDTIVRSTGPGGLPQDWTLFAVAFEGIVRQFFEIDPDWKPDGHSAS
jgi:hypothetical protein